MLFRAQKFIRCLIETAIRWARLPLLHLSEAEGRLLGDNEYLTRHDNSTNFFATQISEGMHALDLLYELEDGLSLLLCLANRYKSLIDDPAHPQRRLT